MRASSVEIRWVCRSGLRRRALVVIARVLRSLDIGNVDFQRRIERNGLSLEPCHSLALPLSVIPLVLCLPLETGKPFRLRLEAAAPNLLRPFDRFDFRLFFLFLLCIGHWRGLEDLGLLGIPDDPVGDPLELIAEVGCRRAVDGVEIGISIEMQATKRKPDDDDADEQYSNT